MRKIEDGTRGMARVRLDQEFRVEDVDSMPGSGGPVVSPDGAWLAYMAQGSGERDSRQVYLVAADGQGGRVQVSRDGGHSPVWSRDGTVLYFLTGTGRRGGTTTVMAVELVRRTASGGADEAVRAARRTVRDLEVSPPAKVFDVSDGVRLIELTPDGEGFFGSSTDASEDEPAAETAGEIIVTLHFSQRIEQLVPTAQK